MTHFISDTQSGSECSCGRVFSVWDMARRDGWSAAHDLQRSINLCQANAQRHAKAANKREESSK